MKNRRRDRRRRRLHVRAGGGEGWRRRRSARERGERKRGGKNDNVKKTLASPSGKSVIEVSRENSPRLVPSREGTRTSLASLRTLPFSNRGSPPHPVHREVSSLSLRTYEYLGVCMYKDTLMYRYVEACRRIYARVQSYTKTPAAFTYLPERLEVGAPP